MNCYCKRTARHSSHSSRTAAAHSPHVQAKVEVQRHLKGAQKEPAHDQEFHALPQWVQRQPDSIVRPSLALQTQLSLNHVYRHLCGQVVLLLELSAQHHEHGGLRYEKDSLQQQK
jgi:hypothetical protein